MLAFGFRRGGDLSTSYVQSARLIVKNAVLWVMFLASMGASVFFSFDSHFNAIFPAERVSAPPRSHHQPDRRRRRRHRALTQKRQIEEPSGLFETDGWKAYDKQLASLAQAAQGAPGEIEKYFVPEDGGAPPAPSPSSRSASPPRRAGRPGLPARRCR
jgi:hypothetical protein